ncbi:hypothetical protein GZ77_03445, partial [Endozoicomonas montiporae]
MLAFLMFSFVIRQGLSILADRPAWSLLAILPDHCHVTGLLPGVISAFVIRQGLSILADRPAWPLLAILPDHCHVTGLWPGV